MDVQIDLYIVVTCRTDAKYYTIVLVGTGCEEIFNNHKHDYITKLNYVYMSDWPFM